MKSRRREFLIISSDPLLFHKYPSQNDRSSDEYLAIITNFIDSIDVIFLPSPERKRYIPILIEKPEKSPTTSCSRRG